MRIILLMLVLMVCWLGIAKYGYEFALDDSAEHYLYYDAQLAQKQLITLPFSDDFKLVTRQQDSLPLSVQQAWRAGLLPLNQVTLLHQATLDTYILPWQPLNSNAVPIFVLHSFNSEDTLSIMPWLVLLITVLSIPVFYIVIKSALKIREQINTLKTFVSTNKQTEQVSKFEELHTFYQALNIARQAQQFAQQRERLVSAYLSHEVRTPLAQIQHGISRLQQLDNMPFEAIDVLQTLELSQLRLTSTSNAVLALWQQDEVAKQQLDLRSIITRVVNTHASTSHPIKLTLDAFEVIKPIHLALFELLITQAIENALQHGASPLFVMVEPKQLIFQNAMPKDTKSSSGVGLGNLLIKQICQRLNWYHSYEIKNSKYTLTIRFKAIM